MFYPETLRTSCCGGCWFQLPLGRPVPPCSGHRGNNSRGACSEGGEWLSCWSVDHEGEGSGTTALWDEGHTQADGWVRRRQHIAMMH